MSPRKNRPVLYEVLRRNNEAARARNGTPTLERDGSADIELTNGQSSAISYTVRRWVESASGRVEFSLSYPVITAAVVGVILIAGLAFWTGMRIGERGANSDKLAAATKDEKRQTGVLGLAEEMRNRSASENGSRRQNEPPKEKDASKEPMRTPAVRTPEIKEALPLASEVEPGTVIKPGLDGAPKAPEAAAKKETPKASEEVEKDPPGKVVLERGKYYVEVQWFRKDKEKDAHAAAKYLDGRGVPVTILRLKENLVLYAREEFDLKGAADRAGEQQRADDLLKKIKSIGREFSKDGGRFTFKDASVKEITP